MNWVSRAGPVFGNLPKFSQALQARLRIVPTIFGFLDTGYPSFFMRRVTIAPFSEISPLRQAIVPAGGYGC